ncbi:hypothetical protein [Rhodopirellula halodulae]|uniref:hypothetical protein n=1 Tax=Rhodopirellula halodulae TaxID=2894198 RepID=UPI001E387084|nr:hypothetical protein [Rhodopirellula sp. JC737]MCC9655277.1 hypothetical protein [Rhodopirellula sp. JC737]
MINCNQRDRNGNCQIVSDLIGIQYKAPEPACKDCLRTEQPSNLNPITAGLAISHAKKHAKEIPEQLIKIAAPELQDDSPKDGPGTELKALIPKLFKKKSCGCHAYARKMNRWGVEGCEKHFDEIVEHLVTQASQHKLTSLFGTASARHVARHWVRQAIQKARQKEATEDKEYTLENWPFVWTYYGAGAIDDELWYSIHLVKKWHPQARCIIVGDKPGWYSEDIAEFVHKPRISKREDQAFKDCYSKLLLMAEKLPRFIWMMDDVYWIKDFSIKEAATPKYVRHVSQQRYYGWVDKKKNKWGRTRQMAYEWLLENNCPTYDFAAHMPQPIWSESFLKNEAELKLFENYRNWENIYFNRYHAAKAEDYGRKFLRVTKAVNEIRTPHKILNHTHAYFKGACVKYLKELLSDQPEAEQLPVKVIIPWKPHPSRNQAFDWVTAYYRSQLGEDTVHIEVDDSKAFNKAAVINRAAKRFPGHILVVGNADSVICPAALRKGIASARRDLTTAYFPHNSRCDMTREQSEEILEQPPEETAVRGRWFRKRRSRGQLRGIFVAHQSFFESNPLPEDGSSYWPNVPYRTQDGPLFHFYHSPEVIG